MKLLGSAARNSVTYICVFSLALPRSPLYPAEPRTPRTPQSGGRGGGGHSLRQSGGGDEGAVLQV